MWEACSSGEEKVFHSSRGGAPALLPEEASSQCERAPPTTEAFILLFPSRFAKALRKYLLDWLWKGLVCVRSTPGNRYPGMWSASIQCRVGMGGRSELHHSTYVVCAWCASRTAYLITNGSYAAPLRRLRLPCPPARALAPAAVTASAPA